MSMNDRLAWHYTTGEKFYYIVKSGLLIPTGYGVIPPEKPVLWFSEHSYFEPTAVKDIGTSGGGRRRATLSELFKVGLGLCRFGCHTEKLLHHRAIQREARISEEQWLALEQIGKHQGSNPLDWWGTTKRLPIDLLVIEVMDEEMSWVRVQ